MAAANTDYFTKVGDPGTATTLAAPGHLIGGTSITVVSTANYPTTTGVIFAIDAVTIVNGEEVRTAGTYTEWEATVTGATTIENMTLRYGTDQNYSAGSTTRVYIPVASSRENRMIDGLLVEHGQNGKHLIVGGAGIGVGNASLNTTAGDIGGAWTGVAPTVVGFASFTAQSCRHTRIGNTAFVFLTISGVSNATSFTIELPYDPILVTSLPVRITDNTSTNQTGLIELNTNGVATVYSTISGATWTASGTKTLHPITLVYEIA